MNDDFSDCKVSDHMSWRRLVPVAAMYTLVLSVVPHTCTYTRLHGEC